MNRDFTIYEFNQLSRFSKYGLLDMEGIFLEVNRFEEHYQIALFQLFDFYVEVWIDTIDNKLYKACAFKSYKRLDRFLKEIDITTVRRLL
jgi:hypothetical protein